MIQTNHGIFKKEDRNALNNVGKVALAGVGIMFSLIILSLLLSV